MGRVLPSRKNAGTSSLIVLLFYVHLASARYYPNFPRKMRTCISCCLSKEDAEFRRWRKSCKPCSNKADYLRRSVKPGFVESNRARASVYWNTNKERVLEYYRLKNAVNPTSNRNKVRAWRDANRLKYKAQISLSKARRRQAVVGPVDIGVVIARYGMICQICFVVIVMNDFSIDHIVPIARGGLHTTDNLQPAHMVCNSRKGTRIGTLSIR